MLAHPPEHSSRVQENVHAWMVTHSSAEATASAGILVFWAALEGCLTCVQYFLREHGMSPYNSSSSGSLTLMDFARWGEHLGTEGASAVNVFLGS